MKKLALALMLASFQCFAQQASDEKQVLDLVSSFFRYIEKQDTLALEKIFLKEAHDYYVKENGSQVLAGGRSSLLYQFSPDQVMTEKIRAGQEKVNIHKRLATVWAPYDFWVNGKIHHCGVDAFTLIKTIEGWRIASIAFTVESENCASR